MNHHHIPQNSENKPRGLYFSKALFEGLIFGGANLWRVIDWASLIVGSKFTVFALFYFVFKGNFPSTSAWGAYIWRGDLMEGFLRYRLGGGGGGYIWRGLFSEFPTISIHGQEKWLREFIKRSPKEKML